MSNDMWDLPDSPNERYEERDNEVMEVGASNLVAGVAMQRVGGNYATAMTVQKKRELPEIRRRLKEEARLAGEGFFYGWGAGKDRIEGPSEALAHSAARIWGNCAVEAAPIQDAGDAWVFTSVFIDLETGFTLTRQFRQSKKWKVYGKLDQERKDDVRFQIGASKAARNVILKALPSALVDEAMKEAKAGVREKIERFVNQKGLPEAQRIAVERLKQFGVTEHDVLRKFDIAEVRALSVDDLVVIQGDIKAIDDGAERAQDLYPKESGPSSDEILSEGSGDADTNATAAKESPEKQQKGSGARESSKAKQQEEADEGDGTGEKDSEPIEQKPAHQGPPWLDETGVKSLRRRADQAGLDDDQWAEILMDHGAEDASKVPASAEEDLVALLKGMKQKQKE